MARFLLVVVGAIVGASPLGAQVKLVWQLEKGDRLVLERNLEQKLLIETKMRPFKQDSSTQWTSSLIVEEKAKDGFVLTWKIESMTRKLADAAAKNPEDKLGDQLKGATFKMKMSSAGRIVKLEGYDDVVKKLTPKMPEVEKALRTLMPASALTEALDESLGFLPEQPVQTGARWGRKTVDPLAPFGAFHAAIDYQYEGEKAGKHHVNADIALTYQPPKDNLGVLKIVQGDVKTVKAQIQYAFDPAARSVQGDKVLHYKGKLELETPKGKDFLSYSAETHVRIRVSVPALEKGAD